MEQGKVCDDAIETRVRERKILRVALAKFDSWPHLLRDRNHLAGKIEPDWDSPALGGSGGDVTRPATDIQDRHLRGHVGGVEELRNELAGRARPSGIVFVGNPLPPFVFEFCKGVFHSWKQA